MKTQKIKLWDRIRIESLSLLFGYVFLADEVNGELILLTDDDGAFIII